MTKRLLIAGSTLLIAACGKVAPLTPEAGKTLPVKPLLADHRPDAAELLSYTPEARPARVDEILTRSQPRKPDRFDLPPGDAGLAPPAPTEPSEPAAVTTGPDNQDSPR
jgi:hypothetical protein